MVMDLSLTRQRSQSALPLLWTDICSGPSTSIPAAGHFLWRSEAWGGQLCHVTCSHGAEMGVFPSCFPEGATPPPWAPLAGGGGVARTLWERQCRPLCPCCQCAALKWVPGLGSAGQPHGLSLGTSAPGCTYSLWPDQQARSPAPRQPSPGLGAEKASLSHVPKAVGLGLGWLGAQLIRFTRVCWGLGVSWARVYSQDTACPPLPATCSRIFPKTGILTEFSYLNTQHILTRALCHGTDSKVLKARQGPCTARSAFLSFPLPRDKSATWVPMSTSTSRLTLSPPPARDRGPCCALWALADSMCRRSFSTSKQPLTSRDA